MQFAEFPLWTNATLFAGAAAGVWAAGTRLAGDADVIAERTGLSRVVLGMVLLGVATSLPEVATTLTASAIGNAQLVSGNLFGGVALQIAVLFPADLVYRGGPILDQLDRSATFAAATGAVVTAIFLVGLLERRNRTVFRMGFDALAVLIVYGVGLIGLYRLR